MEIAYVVWFTSSCVENQTNQHDEAAQTVQIRYILVYVGVLTFEPLINGIGHHGLVSTLYLATYSYWWEIIFHLSPRN